VAWIAAVALFVVMTVIAVALRTVSTGVYSASRTRCDGGARAAISLGVLTRPWPGCADEHGVEVRNLLITRRLPWSEVLEVSFPDGSRWARLELARRRVPAGVASSWWTASARHRDRPAARAARALQHRGHRAGSSPPTSAGPPPAGRVTGRAGSRAGRATGRPGRRDRRHGRLLMIEQPPCRSRLGGDVSGCSAPAGWHTASGCPGTYVAHSASFWHKEFGHHTPLELVCGVGSCVPERQAVCRATAPAAGRSDTARFGGNARLAVVTMGQVSRADRESRCRGRGVIRRAGLSGLGDIELRNRWSRRPACSATGVQRHEQCDRLIP